MMITSITDCTVLNNGVKMPWLGFGVFKTEEGEEVINSVKWALEAGYRSIDTAMVYRNEVGVGKAIKESGVPREEIFLTTKLWNTDVRERRTPEAFNESLERLGVDYVDLYLIHWPVKDGYIEAWKAMESIYASGRAKAIGISNFMIEHLEEFLPECSVTPAVNQIEFHPFLVQPNLLEYCREHKIQVEAYSPIARGEVVSVPDIRKLGERYQKTPTQVVLRWDLQHDVVTIPKSVHKERIIENAQLFDFELSDEDMAFLDSMDEGRRVGSDPYTFTF